MTMNDDELNKIPDVQPDDTSPINLDGLNAGKTMHVDLNSKGSNASGRSTAADESTQVFDLSEPEVDMDSTMKINPPTTPLENGKPKRWLWILVGILFIILGAGLGSYIGYNAAVKARVAAQDNDVAIVTTTQFQLAVMDLEEGRLDNARQRLEYIIQLNPNFPGVTEKLTEVMLAQAVIATPMPEAMPTPVPTKDTRDSEELFLQARQQAANGEWNAVIESLDALRNNDRKYRAVHVDGLYATALRNRGVQRINSGQLEPGIYDITIAGLYGPLDKDAIASSNIARYYLTGAAAWGVDWPKVLEFFAQFYPSAPGLRDATGMTAAERFRKGSILYGDQLMAEEIPCDAAYHYQNALNLTADDLTANKLADANTKCAPPTEIPAPTNPPVEAAPTETPPGDPPPVPTETLPVEPTSMATPGG